MLSERGLDMRNIACFICVRRGRCNWRHQLLMHQYLLQRCYLAATATENIYVRRIRLKKTDWGNRGWIWSLSASNVRKSPHVSQSVSDANTWLTNLVWAAWGRRTPESVIQLHD